MDCTKTLLALAFVPLLLLCPVIHGWGVDGHLVTCRVAQSLLSEAAADAVKQLLPVYAENDLGSVCSWADRVKFRFRWSSALHYINTPDVCNYNYERDCKDENGVKDRCVAGAINNYTTQLLTYRSKFSKAQYNLTQALLFLSHLMGDIHQPLHVSFASDKGGNTIELYWYETKTNLHHVWDDSILETAEERFYNTNVDDLISLIQQNLTKQWANDAKKWGICSLNETTCPDVYATESITAACSWAYKDASDGSTLADDYFQSRLQTVILRLAQGGVRLAATLNRIFG